MVFIYRGLFGVMWGLEFSYDVTGIFARTGPSLRPSPIEIIIVSEEQRFLRTMERTCRVDYLA